MIGNNSKYGLIYIQTALIVCFICLVLPLLATTVSIEKEGYIITHDKKQINGKIMKLYYSDLGCELTFVNLSGDEYQFLPIVIRGFVFENEAGETIKYESKYYKRTWYYLRPQYVGSIAKLYLSPDRKVHFGTTWDHYHIVERDNTEYWIELREKQELIRLYPNSYKKVLRKRLHKYPFIRKKIGKNGYRLKNMPRIIKELNELYGEETKQI